MDIPDMNWGEVSEYARRFLENKPSGDEAALRELLDKLWGKYVTAEAEESERAKELIMWYATKKGAQFKKEGGEWGEFMKKRPEIILGLRQYFSDSVIK